MDKQILEKLVSFRKELYQYPETGFEEFETRKRIMSILK